MKILATGASGYIGTTLVPFLLEKGHEVTVLDRFFFGEDLLSGLKGSLKLVRDDTRWFDGKILKGIDAVVDMAALSNDPAGELDPWKTIEINYLGRARVARLAREAGVRRYLLLSSCSIYGFQDGFLTEESTPNPLTTYARANLLAEKDNLPLGSADFVSTAVRLATAYGLSRRMRFDIAINGMALGGLRNSRIPIMRDGTQWRPFVHVKDISRAILTILEADASKVNGELFNIGSDEQNYQIKSLAEIVADSLSKKPSIEWYGDPDKRSYRVSFRKAREVLGFQAKYTPADAVKEIEKAIRSKEITDDVKTKTVEWYKLLLTDTKLSNQVAIRGVVL